MSDLFQAAVANDMAVKRDALTLLQGLPSGSVDLVVTDAAYESLEKHRAVGTTTRLTKKWFTVFPNNRLPGWMRELYRVMKPKRHAYLFCDEETRDLMVPMARAAGFWVWKSIPYVKVKLAVSRGPVRDGSPILMRDEGLDEPEILQLLYGQLKSGTGYHWRATREFVLFLEKRTQKQSAPKRMLDVGGQVVALLPGSPIPRGKGLQLNHKGWPDVLFGVRDDSGYPTQKCPHTIRRLIRNSSQPGEVVLDTFAGSGVVGDVARQEDRRFIICDIADAAIAEWQKRGLFPSPTE